MSKLLTNLSLPLAFPQMHEPILPPTPPQLDVCEVGEDPGEIFSAPLDPSIQWNIDQENILKQAREARDSGDSEGARKILRQATEILDQLSKDDPANRATYQARKGQQCYEFGLYEEAVEALSQVDESCLLYYEALETRRDSYVVLKKFNEALRDAVVLKVADTSPKNIYACGYIRFRQLDYSGAIRDFSELIDAAGSQSNYNSELQFAYSGRTQSLCKIWKDEDGRKLDERFRDCCKAAEDFKKAKELSLKNGPNAQEDIFHLNGQLSDFLIVTLEFLKQENRYEDAIRLLDIKLDLDPLQYGIHFSKAELYELMGSNEQAIREYESILVPSDNSPIVHKGLAMVLLKENRKKESEDHFAQAASAMQSKDYLARAKIYETMGGEEEALRDYEQYLRIVPSDEVRQAKISLHLKRGEYLEGIKEYLNNPTRVLTGTAVGMVAIYILGATGLLVKIFADRAANPQLLPNFYSDEEAEKSVRNYACDVLDAMIGGDRLSDEEKRAFLSISTSQLTRLAEVVTDVGVGDDQEQKIQEALEILPDDEVREVMRENVSYLISQTQENKKITLIGQGEIEKNFVYDRIVPASQIHRRIDRAKLNWALEIFLDETRKHVLSTQQELLNKVENPSAANLDSVSNSQGSSQRT